MDKPLIILGGGLWGSLLAYRLHKVAPQINYILFEKENHLGGNHTWSFFGSDMDEDNFQWVRPFIHKSWPKYEVAFPKYNRILQTPYHTITSESLHALVSREVPPHKIRPGKSLSLSEAGKIGSFVIDARGISHVQNKGFQKFLGMKIKTRRPHELNHPIIMDATVAQLEGFRFFYFLPLSEDTVLVEDTRYSMNGEIDQAHFRAEILKETARRGWIVDQILGEEEGSLPIPLSLVLEEESQEGIKLSGLYNDTTGYSLPMAVKLVDELGRLKHFDEASVRWKVREFRQRYTSQRTFYRLLNHLLFKSASPDQSYRMLEFFYSHPELLIQRFYAGEFSGWDKVKFFMGKPPVSITDALSSFVKKETQ